MAESKVVVVAKIVGHVVSSLISGTPTPPAQYSQQQQVQHQQNLQRASESVNQANKQKGTPAEQKKK